MPKIWPWILTAFAVVGAILVFFYLSDMQGRSQIGGFISGFASVIAFIWLIAAYLQQGQELRMQREELSLQRNTLDIQREEVKRMGKYAALQQITRLFEKYEQQLKYISDNDKDFPCSFLELPAAFINGINLWETIIKQSIARHKNYKAIYGTYLKWLKVESCCNDFIAQIITALEIYEEATDAIIIIKEGTPIDRFYSAYKAAKDIPFIKNYVGIAEVICSQMLSTEKNLSKIKEIGDYAIDKISKELLKEAAPLELDLK